VTDGVADVNPTALSSHFDAKTKAGQRFGHFRPAAWPFPASYYWGVCGQFLVSQELHNPLWPTSVRWAADLFWEEKS
jgi:hypothetical protein